MKKALMYIVVATVIIVGAFFAYKQLYGSGMFEKKRQESTPATLTAENAGLSLQPIATKGAMFGD